MKNTKLINLLKSLNAEDLRWFYKFLQSPFFNSNKNILALFEHLRKFHPAFDSPSLTKESVFQKIFSNKTFRIKKLDDLMYHLTVLLEDFLISKTIRSNVSLRKKALTQAYNEQNLYTFFEKNTQKRIQHQKSKTTLNLDESLELFQLHHDLYFHPNTPKQKEAHSHLYLASEHIDSFYIQAKLRLIAEMKARETTLGESVSIPKLKDFASQKCDCQICSIYLKIIELYDSENELLYFEIKEQFLNSIEYLNQHDSQLILSHLQNFAIRQSKKEDMRFADESFELYRYGLQYDLLTHHQQMSDSTFINIVISSAKLNELDWAFHFIQQYKSLLNPNTQKDVNILAMAYWYFFNKNFSKTVDLLQDHSSQKTFFQINERSLLFRASFELFLIEKSWFQFLENHAKTFERYIRRKSGVSKNKELAYLNFIHFSRKLANYLSQNSMSKKTVSLWLSKLNGITPIVSKTWLAEKIESSNRQI